MHTNILFFLQITNLFRPQIYDQIMYNQYPILTVFCPLSEDSVHLFYNHEFAYLPWPDKSKNNNIILLFYETY